MTRFVLNGSGPSAVRARFARWLAEHSDEFVLRWLFRALIVATVVMAALDYRELSEAAANTPDVTRPDAPPASPLPTARPDKDRPAPTRDDERRAAAMTFDLVEGGRLEAIGTIMPGSAQAFAAEIAKRGSYVTTVVLDSPGGSVADAMAMGRLIRQRGISTQVDSGGYCASSCPLVFAGGVERRALGGAAIGVHQVSAAAGAEMNGERGMDRAQRVSAECQKYLGEMGVDLGVWIHAMETPRDRLFYFQRDELLALKLATEAGSADAGRAARAAY